MSFTELLVATTVACCFGYGVCYFTKSEDSYKQGFEAGKNYVPYTQQVVDSIVNSSQQIVVYHNNKPMVSDHIKMPRDSVQLIIDNFMDKPKQYLLITLKLVTKEK